MRIKFLFFLMFLSFFQLKPMEYFDYDELSINSQDYIPAKNFVKIFNEYKKLHRECEEEKRILYRYIEYNELLAEIIVSKILFIIKHGEISLKHIILFIEIMANSDLKNIEIIHGKNGLPKGITLKPEYLDMLWYKRNNNIAS